MLCHVDGGQVRRLLRAHGVVAGALGARVFATVDEGLLHVEEQYLKVCSQGLGLDPFSWLVPSLGLSV